MKRLIDQYIRNDEEQRRADRVGELAERFAERAFKHDREGSFPFENFVDLKDAGYLKLMVPREYGGDGLSLREMVGLQERLARGDGSTALAVGWHMGIMLNLRSTRKWPEELFAALCRDVVAGEAMINTFATERGSGSPNRGGKPETTAVRDPDGGWRITGRKTFSTLSPILDRFVVSAYLPEENVAADFLVRRSGQVELVETWDTLGMRATGSHDIVLNGAFAEADARIPAGLGIDDASGWLLHIPACYLGIAIAARDYAVKFAKSHRPNHLQSAIADLPTVQQQIGAMEADIRTARCLLYEAADRWDRLSESERPGMKPELGLAKYVATNNAIKVVDVAMRLVGGASLSKTSPLERYYRDVRAGLHNPPMDTNVLQTLANEALNEF